MCRSGKGEMIQKVHTIGHKNRTIDIHFFNDHIHSIHKNIEFRFIFFSILFV